MADAALTARIETWQRDTPPAKAPFADRWACYTAGLDLLEQAYVAGDREGLGHLFVGLDELRRTFMVDREAAEAEGQGDDLAEDILDEPVRELIGAVEDRLDELLADTGIAREVLVRELEGLRLRRQQLRMMLEGGRPEKHLANDLDDFSRAAARIADVDPEEAETLRAQEAELRVFAVDRVAERALGKLEAHFDELTLPELWAAVGDVERWLDQAHGFADTAELIEKLRGKRERLMNRAAEVVDGLEPADRQAWLESAGEEERERVEEVLTAVEEIELAGATAALERSQQRIDFQLQRWASRDEPLPKALKRARQRLFNEWVEKSVQLGLERRFGRTFVTLLENTVLFLIVLVCALLGVEWVFHDWAMANQWELAYADGLICAVFLFEFIVKIWHAPSAGNFFRRHWLIDLLPSIPFGLITLSIFGAVGQAAQGTTAIRAARFLRLPRLARYVRLARPLIRVLRIVIFALRGIDRVIRRYGRLINRNITFFEPAPETDDKDLLYRLDSLRLRTRGAKAAVLRAMDAHARTEHHALMANVIGARLDRFDCLKNGAVTSLDDEDGGPSRDIRIERVIDNLIRLEADELTEHFGPEFTKRVAKLTRVCSLPLIKRLPLFADIAAAREGTKDEAELVTRSARALGRALQRVLASLYWVADLHGVLSASQLIDRLGGAMAKVTERPAKRLLMFGGGFLLLSGFLYYIPIAALNPIAVKIRNILGVPIIVLGAICLVVLAIGKWFQRIAGAAGEFYERAAEAQFLGLIKDVKRGQMEDHRRWLEARLLRPEALLRDVRVTSVARGQTDFAHRLAGVLDPTGTLEPGGAAERVYLLYRHFLDGAPLHRTGATTTNQLLGNLVIENVQRERLGYSKSQMRALQRLDLERSKGLGGPYLWFNFITLAVAQKTARLVVEYNIHCVPEREQALYPEDELAATQAWLAARHGSADGEHPQPLSRGTRYRTAAFTAIDFLTCDPERDAAIETTFGAQVREALQRDRRLLIREVFGTFPAASWPRADRSINPYDLYWRFIGNGRALFLPLAMAWYFAKACWFLGRMLIRTIRDLLNPAFGATAEHGTVASYEVAVRKINRLRKPVFMEATKLRSEFDFEFLGLQLPGTSDAGIRGHGYRDDLGVIGALDEEVAQFTALKREHRNKLMLMTEFLQRIGWDGPGLGEYLAHETPSLVGREREVLRAIALAFVADYREIATMMQIERGIAQQIEECESHEGRVPGHTPARAAVAATLRTATAWAPPAFKTRQAFDEYWEKHDLGDEEVRQRARRYARTSPELARLLRKAAKYGGEPLAAAKQIAEEVAHHPQTWTEQLLTVRTVQSLALLDVLTDRRLVRDLGYYEDAEVAPEPVVLPWL